METSVNIEEPLEKQLHELINKIVGKAVNERLRNLLQPLLLSEEPLVSNQLVATQTEAKRRQSPCEKQETLASTETMAERIVCGDTNDGGKEAPKKLCELKIKRMLRELTPDLKRRTLPLLIQTRMLMKLYEHQEYGIPPKELFSYAGTGKIAGYRYISFFKERGFSTFTGARKAGKYILTLKGIELLEMQ